MNRGKSDEWETPAWFFDRMNERFHFDMDVACTEQNAKCAVHFTEKEDGLKQKWKGTVWCNPPYSNITPWVQKAVAEMENGVTTVMLTPARTDVQWFHRYVYKKDGIDIEFIEGRIIFVGAKVTPPFGSMIMIFHGK